MAILEDDVGDNISTAGGKVVIDLGGVLVQLGEQVGLPQGVLDAIPDDAGVFEVVDSDQLETAQLAVEMIKIMSILFFLLVVILYLGAIYLAHNWRRAAVRNVGLATALGGFVVLVALRLGINFFAGSPDTEGGRAAADSILTIGTALLRQTAWSEILIGVLIALGASLWDRPDTPDRHVTTPPRASDAPGSRHGSVSSCWSSSSSPGRRSPQPTGSPG